MVTLIQFSPLLVLLAGVALTLIQNPAKWNSLNNPFTFRKPVFFVFLVLFFGCLWSAMAIGQIEAGHRGVVTRFGAVTTRTLGEGIYVVVPFVNGVEVMDVQTHLYEAPAAAGSKDLQDVHTSVALNYHLNPASVNTVYQTMRREYETRLIAPAVQESVKAVTATFKAEDLIIHRPVVKSQLEDTLRNRLGASGVVVDTVSLTDFQFSDVFSNSIEAKQVAAQRALEAENLLQQIRVEAQQAEARATGERNAAIARAEGDRQSAIYRAEGEAQAILSVAEAQAKANHLLDQSLTENVIRYALVKELGNDIHVVVLPSGQDFILGPEVLSGK